MAFVDSVKEMFSQAGQSAKGFSDIAKLKSTISSTENQINELYGKIGYSIYCKYANNPLPEVAEMINQVNILHAQINECKAQITAINNADICPHCGGKINRNSAFCPNCGGRIEDAGQKSAQYTPPGPIVTQTPVQQPTQQAPAANTPTPAEAPAPAPEQKTIAFCSNCGASLAPDSVFCMNCGTKI